MTRINTPKEVLALAGSSAADKLQNTAGKTLILAFLAGAYIAIGGLFSLMAGFGFPGAAEAPGFQRLLSGAVFPLGLILVVFTGAELFTGNNAVLMPGALGRRYGWGKVARNWTLVWLGNFAGALFFTYFLVVLPGVLSSEMWREAACNIAQAKVSLPWSTVFLRGVGANWLVCLAVWLGMSANDVPGRMIGLFFPIMCFVVIGYEHCIANMFFIPLGMLLGAPVSAAELFAAIWFRPRSATSWAAVSSWAGCTGISTGNKRQEIPAAAGTRQQGHGSPARNPGHEPSHTHAVRIHEVYPPEYIRAGVSAQAYQRKSINS